MTCVLKLIFGFKGADPAEGQIAPFAVHLVTIPSRAPTGHVASQKGPAAWSQEASLQSPWFQPGNW